MRTNLAAGLKIIVVLLFAVNVAVAQKGPGGVSVETTGPANSTCKLWYNAGALNYADGTFVDTLNDISLSANDNYAWQDTASYSPMYRNDPSASINGEPVLIFGTPSASYMKLESSDDINLAKPMNKRSMFIAFRTSSVWQHQVVFEQGGNVRGLNVTIFQGYIYITAYDIRNDGDGTPTYGPVTISQRIFANTNNVLALRFFGPSGNLGGFIEGHLNGVPFSSIGTGVGSIWEHPGAPGLGAVHGQAILHDGTVTGTVTGDYYFRGSIAELVSYSDTINAAQRIIVENYLGSKYGNRTMANDFYAYDENYGKRVFGIGQVNGQRHNLSQGAGIFEVSGNLANFQDGKFLLIGDNNAPLTETVVNIPNNSSNTKRVAREWRVDRNGNLGPYTIRVEASKLPALGNGFTKYVLIKDNKAGLTSKFAGSEVEIIELIDDGNGYYTTTTSLDPGIFLTFGLIKPQVLFTAATDYGFEENINTTETATVTLNYLPATNVNFNYSFIAGSAFAGSDYLGSNGIVTFNSSVRTANISFTIVGDVSPESSETFSIQLSAGVGSTAGIGFGSIPNLEFSIYDNDNDPEVSFATNLASVSEDADSVLIDIVRAGDASIPFSVNCRLRTSGVGAGTAINNSDYTFTNPTNVSFAPGEVLKQVVIYLNDDNRDEEDESIFLELYGVNGLVDLVTPNEFELTIADDDVPPTVQFLDANYFAPESFGEPDIQIVLSGPSDKDIQVRYYYSGGTANPLQDYVLTVPGDIIIPAGDTTARIPLITLQDGIPEADETVLLNLANNANLINATLGAQTSHTFTIKDYLAFEWLGPAGVGQINEVPLWVDADREVGTQGQNFNSITNFSTQPIDIDFVAGKAKLQTTNLINGRQSFRFDASDRYTMTNSNNLNGAATNRHYWMFVRTVADVTSRQVIYSEGGGLRGLNIYILNGRLYFHIYNDVDDNGPGSAYGPASGNPQFVSAPISATTNYIIYAKYDLNSANSIELYLNGVLVGSIPSTSFPGQLYGHVEANLGGQAANVNPFHDGRVNSPCYFNGYIGELIAYQNPPMTATRENLINNYLSAKYAMPFPGVSHNITIPSSAFGNNLAGIGSEGSTAEHTDAQGTSRVRINSANSLDAGDYMMWHDNGGDISDSVTTNLPTAFTSRLAYVLQVEEDGEVGNVKLSFDIAGFGLTSYTIDDIELLISNDANDFSSAARHISGRSLVGNSVIFTGVNLNEGQYFTIGFAPNDCIEGLWTGAVSNDWNDLGNWDCNEVPTAVTDVVIPAGAPRYPVLDPGVTYPTADVTINAGANITNTVIAGVKPVIEVNGNWTNLGSVNGFFQADFVGTTVQTIDGDNSFAVLNIANANGVTVNSGDQVITEALELVTGALNTNNAVTLKSDVQSTAYINDFAAGYTGTISGNITVERFIGVGASGFRYVGFPVNGATINQLSDDIAITATNGAVNGSPVTPTSGCDPNNLAAGSPYGSVFDYREQSVTTCELRGWHVRTSGAVNSAQGIAINTVAGITLDQTGTYRTGNISSLPLTYTATNTSGKIGRSLLANPYQSDLNWGDVASSASNNNITGEAFVFITSGSYQGTYTTYNLANNANLAPGQGFFVINTVDNSTLDFDNSMRRESSGNYYRSTTIFDKKLDLKVEGNGKADVTTILFDIDFTTQYDRLYDGRKLKSANGNVTLFTYTDTTIGMQAINALPNDGTVTSVPVGFLPGATGAYSISAELAAGFGSSALVLLEDLKLGTMHNLRAGDYNFNADAQDDEMRFVLHFVPEAIITSTPVNCEGTEGNIVIDMGTHVLNGAAIVWDAITVTSTDGTSETANNVAGIAYQANDVAAGNYTVEFTYGNYTTSQIVEVTSANRVVADAEVSALTIEVGEPIDLTSLATGASNIEWNLGDGNTIANVTSFSHSYFATGVYTIKLSASNNECSDEASYQVTVNQKVTGVNNAGAADEITMFADQNSIHLNFNNYSLDNSAQVELYNLMGQLVMPSTDIRTVGTVSINVKDALAPGMYIVLLNLGNGNIMDQKIMVTGN